MTAQSAPAHSTGVAIVVIGRNEGERLARCLASIATAGNGAPLVYVDSGSDDGSADRARAEGVMVVELAADQPFTAARARNMGLAWFDDPAIRYIQMLDGDTELQPGWIARAQAALDDDPSLVAVFGRRRERFPAASLYNRLCDDEWAVPPGETEAFGGDVMLRREAAAIGYDPAMIAGEDVDLALRLKARGGRILCLDSEMTLHDAAILDFGAWWRRTTRAGHAFAELDRRHRAAHGSPYRRNVRRILFWGGVLPLFLVGTLSWAVISGRWLGFGIGIALLAAQFVRMMLREWRHHRLSVAAGFALLLGIGKYAELAGLLRFHADRLRGRRKQLIEYKRSPAA